MKKFLGLVVILLIGGAAGALAMGDLYVSGTWRYRITVEVETPEGVKTGSAVHEVSNSASSVRILDFPESTNAPDFKGEAVVVDLSPRGVVFAILPTDPYYMFYNAFLVPGVYPSIPEGIKYFNSLKKGDRRVLDPKDYPTFVTFRDLKDPKTVTLVKGSKFDVDKQATMQIDKFEEVFGQAVHIKKITLEITDEKVTRSINNYLPSFEEKTGFLEWFKKLPYDDPRRIGPNNFK